MEIWIYNIEKKKELKLDFKIEASYPVSDLFVVYANKNETTILFDGKNSKHYDSYLFRKILSITKGHVIYENIKHFIVFVEYLNDYGQLDKFLIESNSEKGYVVFDNNNESGDFQFNDAVLINYEEYLNLKKLFGENDIMSFKDFIRYKISHKGSSDQNSRFSIPTIENNDFISANGLNYFLDLQESDKSKLLKGL